MNLIPMKYDFIETIGLSFLKGGIKGSMINNNFNGYKIINHNSKLLTTQNTKLSSEVSNLNNWIANQNVDINYKNKLIVKSKQNSSTPGIMYNKIIDVKSDDLIKFKISGFKDNDNFLVYPYIFDYDKNISLSNCIKSLDIKSSEVDIELIISNDVKKIVLYILFNIQKIN